jgi:hypothetical protein
MSGFFIDSDGNLHTGTTGKLIDDTQGNCDWLPLLRQIVDLRRFAGTGRWVLNAIHGFNFAHVEAAGSNQATAAAISGSTTFCEVHANAFGRGVILPSTLSVNDFLYVNAELSDASVNVYPPVGAQIDSLGANTPLVLASDSTAFIRKTGASTFTSSVTVNS